MYQGDDMGDVKAVTIYVFVGGGVDGERRNVMHEATTVDVPDRQGNTKAISWSAISLVLTTTTFSSYTRRTIYVGGGEIIFYAEHTMNNGDALRALLAGYRLAPGEAP